MNCFNNKKINDYNPGIVFQGSIRILLTTILKYDFFIKSELHNKKKIYISKNVNQFFLSLLKDYEKRYRIKFSYINGISKNNQNSYKYIGKLTFDIDGRFRNLSSSNYKSKFENFVLNHLLTFINKIKLFFSKKKIIFIDNIDKIQNENFQNIFIDNFFFININKNNFFKYLLNRKFLFFPNIFLKNNTKSSLFRNLFIKSLDDHNLFYDKHVLTLFEKYLFQFFDDFNLYFRNKLKFLSDYSNLTTIISGSDSHENSNILFNIGKKLNISNIILPHGIFDDDFYLNYKYGYIHKAFAHGNQQFIHFKNLGLKEANIIKFEFPHYSKSINFKNISNCKNKAIILAYELCNYYPISSLRELYNYYFNTTKFLKDLNFTEILIKSRSNFDFHYQNHLKKFCEKNNLVYASGYSKLINYLDKYEIVLGPKSTAIFETLLYKKNYYLFSNDQNFKNIESSLIYFNNNDINKLNKKNFLPILMNKKYDINHFIYKNNLKKIKKVL